MNNLKKIIYIILTSILGMLIGFNIWLLLTTMPINMQLMLLIFLGALIGIDWGFRWWRIVYIEHRTWHNFDKK